MYLFGLVSLVSSGKFPKVKLLCHTVYLFLVFWGTSTLLPTVFEKWQKLPIYIPTICVEFSGGDSYIYVHCSTFQFCFNSVQSAVGPPTFLFWSSTYSSPYFPVSCRSRAPTPLHCISVMTSAICLKHFKVVSLLSVNHCLHSLPCGLLHFQSKLWRTFHVQSLSWFKDF